MYNYQVKHFGIYQGVPFLVPINIHAANYLVFFFSSKDRKMSLHVNSLDFDVLAQIYVCALLIYPYYICISHTTHQ